jgi:hypothetical protein
MAREARARCQVLKVANVPQCALVFALLAEKYSLNFERVTVLLNPRGMGCELGLTHETRVEFAQRSRRDWVGVLERLGAMLSKAGRTAA